MKTFEKKTFFNDFHRRLPAPSMQSSYSTPLMQTRLSNKTFAARSSRDFELPEEGRMGFKKIRTEKLLEVGQTRQLTGQLLNFKKCLHKNTQKEQDPQQYLSEIRLNPRQRGPQGAREVRLAEKVREAEERLWEMQMSLLSHRAKKHEILLNTDPRRGRYG